jgi:HTH-type transcriptional regulator/antitoxin HigA
MKYKKGFEITPIHLRPILEAMQHHDIKQVDLAARMGRPGQAINEILRNKKAITAETALQLEKVLGISASHILSLQSEHDLRIAYAKYFSGDLSKDA